MVALDVEKLRASLAANKEEKVRVFASNQDTQILLLMGALEALVSGQQKLVERVEESDRRTKERFASIEKQLAATTGRLADLANEERQAETMTAATLEDVEQRLGMVTKQVDNVVAALKVGKQVRKRAMHSVNNWVKNHNAIERNRDRGIALFQRRVREHCERLRKRKKIDEASNGQIATRNAEEIPQYKMPSPTLWRKPSEGVIAELDDMIDDGTTTANLFELEQVLTQRLDMLEQKTVDLERGSATLEKAENPFEEKISQIVVPLAERTAREILQEQMKQDFDGGTSVLEIRRDLNAVTRFADEMQKRCEKALIAADASRALKRKVRTEEASARVACLETLHALRNAIAARRAMQQDEAVNNLELFFRYAETIVGSAVQGMANIRTKFEEDDEIDELPASTLLRLRVLASLLDGALDFEPLRETKFGHETGRLVNIGTGGEPTSRGPIEAVTWDEALRQGLKGIIPLIDRHVSPSLAYLDVVRMRAEFNGLPINGEFDALSNDAKEERNDLEEPGSSSSPSLSSSRYSVGTNEVCLTLDEPWRLSEHTSEVLRASGLDFFFFAKESDLTICLRKHADLAGYHGDALAAARGIAKDAQRHAASLDAAIQELVAQMQHGFASREDYAKVERALAQLGDRLRSAKDDIDNQRAQSHECADHLLKLADQVRAAATRSPSYNRLEKILERKADVNDVLDLKGRLSDVNAFHEKKLSQNGEAHNNHRTSSEFATFVTKCLACNRPFSDVDIAPRPNPPPLVVPPGALVAPGARVPSIMPPSAGGVVPGSVGACVEMHPTQRDDKGATVLSTFASQKAHKVYESPPKKTMSLQFDGVQDSNVIISRAGANRLMPLSSKRAAAEQKLLHLSKGQPPPSMLAEHNN